MPEGPEAAQPFTPERGEITLGALVKVVLGVSGGLAKRVIQQGGVRVDGEVETRRGRRLGPGALVEIEGAERAVRITAGNSEPRRRIDGDRSGAGSRCD